MSLGSDEEIYSDDGVYSTDEEDDSGQESGIENNSHQGLSDESEIENDESGSDVDDNELVIGSRYMYNNVHTNKNIL